MFTRITLPGLCLFLVLLLLVNVVAVSLGEEQSNLKVVNQTEHFLHVFIEGESFLYVAPGRGVIYSSGPRPDAVVSVVFAPGQGVSGSADTTMAIPYAYADHGCTCAEGSSQSECSYTPPSGGSAELEVTEEFLRDQG